MEYAHAIQDIKEALISDMPRFCVSTSGLEPLYADVRCSVVCPLQASESANRLEFVNSEDSNGFVEGTNMAYGIGGLTWSLPEGHKMDDYLIFWIGLDNSAFANVVLQFNSCEIGKSIDFLGDCAAEFIFKEEKLFKQLASSFSTFPI